MAGTNTGYGPIFIRLLVGTCTAYGVMKSTTTSFLFEHGLPQAFYASAGAFLLGTAATWAVLVLLYAHWRKTGF